MTPNTDNLRDISQQDFAVLGIDAVAYVRYDTEAARSERYVICAADGSELGRTRDYNQAVATVREYDLEPVWAH